MKLTIKIPLAFATAMVAMLAAALLGIGLLHRSVQTYSTTVMDSYTHAAAAAELQSQFKSQVQEWKNTLLRGKNPQSLERYWNSFKKLEGEIAAKAGTLMRTMPAGEARTLIERFEKAHATMGKNYQTAFEAFKAADFDPAVGDKAVSGMDREPSKLLGEASKLLEAQSLAQSNAAAAQGRQAALTSLGLMLVVALVGTAVGVGFGRGIARSIARAAEVTEAVAGGDLSVAVRVHGKDEVAQLLGSLQSMQSNLVRVVGGVRAGSDSVANASAQIAHGNQDLSQRTEQQASALQETAASMEELGTTVKHNADNARQANQLAQNASTVAVKGGDVVNQVVQTMKGINDSSRQIADIIGVIDGIAFQTNILALNAAVEAARAGEQGRGFAVVASEVRSLASRSAAAAREIKSLITASVERVEQGTALVDQAGTTMSEVVASIRRVTDIVGEISSASSQQSAGVSQVGDAVAQMDRATQQNAALVEESAAAAESLRQQAQQLVDAVAVFRLGAHT